MKLQLTAALATKGPMTDQHHGCDCPSHRPQLVKMQRQSDGGRIGWGALLPVLACAICPACLATYAKVLSLFGIGVRFTESHHALLLAVAVAVSVVVSALRTWRSGRAWPLATATIGASLIAVGHLAHDLHWLEWAGVVVLLIGGVLEQLRRRTLHHQLLPQQT